MEPKKPTPTLSSGLREACGEFEGLARSLTGETGDDANGFAAHRKLCDKLHRLYVAKNLDYGDAFHITFEEEGPAAGRVRLTDKLERFKTLTRRDGEAYVSGESIRDTLLDLANYALMTVMELDRTPAENEQSRSDGVIGSYRIRQPEVRI